MTTNTLKKLCSSCSLKELCLPVGLNDDEITMIDSLMKQSKRIDKGEYIFRSSDKFVSLYSIRTGFFKTNVSSIDGREQVTGFYMSGELIGMDGIFNNIHSCNAVALENSEVCELPYKNIEELSSYIPSLRHHYMRLMSNEIIKDQNIMLLLGNMKASERIAAFLLNMSKRLAIRGFSQDEFVLRMSREEIGSYLGIKLETVSRVFSKFHQDGIIFVNHKYIKIINPLELQKIHYSDKKVS